jgi:hypothetical protein
LYLKIKSIFLVDIFNNKTNKKLAILQGATFQVGSGGFNGPRSNPNEIKAIPIPQRAPDHITEEKTTVDQVLLINISVLLNF